MTSAVDGQVVLSSGASFESGLVVWTAGNAANPVVSRHTDLPVDERGFVVVRPDLRVGTPDGPIEHAWAAGDDAAVPDLAAGDGAYTVANALSTLSGRASVWPRTSSPCCAVANRSPTATTASGSSPPSGSALGSSSPGGS